MNPKLISYEVVFEGGRKVSKQVEATTNPFETRIGQLRLTVIWDQFLVAMQPTPTIILRNTFLGSGIVRWESGIIRVGNYAFSLGEKGCMPPRYAFIRSTITLDNWKMIPEEENLPQWIRAQALHEIENKKQSWVGPYNLWWTDASAYDAGGHGIAPFHGGSKDWLVVCAEGKARRWAEAIGAMSLGIWLDYDPASNGELYWWDASAIEYAPPGFQWKPATDGFCAYEQIIAKRPIMDISHGRRFYGAVSALAKYCQAARYMLIEAIWPEVCRSYSMDRRMPEANIQGGVLYAPLWQVLELTEEGNIFAPPSNAPWGNRREAHAINMVYECFPYVSQREAQTYLPAWTKLLKQLDDGRGVLDRSFTGDAQSSSGLEAPACMAFQQQLLSQAARQLGEYCKEAKEVGDRIAKWWGQFPPYYAHTGGTYASAQQAPHSGQSVVDYTWFTHPRTVNFQQVVEQSKGQHFDESHLDCVPPERRQW